MSAKTTVISRRAHLKGWLGGLMCVAAAPMLVPMSPARAAAPIAAPELRVPERITIPTIQVDARIVPVGPTTIKVDGKVSLQWGAPNSDNVGWHNYSGHLGERKNIVLNGHNNIYGSVFRKLYTLKAGDQVQLSAGANVGAVHMTYQVQEVLILKERDMPVAARARNAKYIQPIPEERLTLVSCWPETSNTHRVIVIALPA